MKYRNYIYIDKQQGLLGYLRILLLAVFFLITVAVLLWFLKQSLLAQEHAPGRIFGLAVYQTRNTTPGESNSDSVSSWASTQDPRAYVLDEYFRHYGSPLYGTGNLFVDACDKYGAPADCTTVAAIAHAETDLCKYHTSASYHNCWGFGGGEEHRMYFGSWNESIDLVTDRLVNSYGLRYMIDPSLMERTFCGWEPGCTNWGNRVKYFMKNISDFSVQLGFSYTMFDLR